MDIEVTTFQGNYNWYVKGVVHNVVAKGDTAENAMRALAKILQERYAVASHLGLDPFEGVTCETNPA